jgi:hypothetical protein
MSRRTRVVGSFLAVATLAGTLVSAVPQEKDPNKGLAKEQLKMSREALKQLDILYKRGELNRTDPRFALWSRREVEALRASGAGNAELVAALEAYVRTMRARVKATEELVKRDQATRVDLLDAQYNTLEAEMWLNREKTR